MENRSPPPPIRGPEAGERVVGLGFLVSRFLRSLMGGEGVCGGNGE